MRSHVLRTARIHNTAYMCMCRSTMWCVQPVQSVALPYILIHPRKRIHRNRLPAGHWPRRFSTMSPVTLLGFFFFHGLRAVPLCRAFRPGVEIMFPRPVFSPSYSPVRFRNTRRIYRQALKGSALGTIEDRRWQHTFVLDSHVRYIRDSSRRYRLLYPEHALAKSLLFSTRGEKRTRGI